MDVSHFDKKKYIDSLRFVRKTKKYNSLNAEIILAFENEDVLGNVSFYDGGVYDGSYTIHWLYVFPSKNGRGIGSKLVSLVEDIAVSESKNLEAYAIADGALSFWEKMGFEIILSDDGCYVNGFKKLVSSLRA